MSSENESGTVIEVTDQDGWKKDFPLNEGKSIVLIGSDPTNDVVLEPSHGGGVAPRHLQLIFAGTECRMVNLGGADVVLRGSEEGRVAPHSYAEVASGQRVDVGDFGLTLKFGPMPVSQAAGLEEPVPEGGVSEPIGTGPIGLRVVLPQVQLTRHQPLEGTIVVRNQGDKSGIQVRLELEGLPPDSYEMGPGPILFPGGEKEVFLRLHPAKRSMLRAGKHGFTIHATAPDAYPGGGMTHSQDIEALPFYHHSLRLVPVDKRGGS